MYFTMYVSFTYINYNIIPVHVMCFTIVGTFQCFLGFIQIKIVK